MATALTGPCVVLMQPDTPIGLPIRADAFTDDGFRLSLKQVATLSLLVPPPHGPTTGLLRTAIIPLTLQNLPFGLHGLFVFFRVSAILFALALPYILKGGASFMRGAAAVLAPAEDDSPSPGPVSYSCGETVRAPLLPMSVFSVSFPPQPRPKSKLCRTTSWGSSRVIGSPGLRWLLR